MTPDSLEVSRSRRRSPRRSYSAESIVPCPASGRQLDSVSPPSGLRFSGSAGLSPCTCATPSPCPASRRRTSSPLTVCPAARGIDSVTPPSGILATTCPSYSGAGTDSMTLPSGLFSSSSPCPCSPSSPGIDSVTPPSGLFSGSPCPCSSSRRSSTPPCAPAPCAPPPCSPDPYANIKRPKRFFAPLTGRRSSTPPPCAPTPRSPPPCSPPPCSPPPCLPPPCSPDPCANISRPRRYSSPLAELAKSASMEYDEDPFYGLGDGIGIGSESCACATPSPTPSPIPACLRGSVPKGFYRLTGDLPSPRSTPRRTRGTCPARASLKPRRVCGSPPPPSPAPCPAATSCEVEHTPSGVVRRSYTRDGPSAASDGQRPVTTGASASFAMSSKSPDPDPEEFTGKWMHPMPMWEDLVDPEDCCCDPAKMKEAFAFFDEGPGRFDFPPDDTFYEFENAPCPAAESTGYVPKSICRSRSPSPVCGPPERSSSSPRSLRQQNASYLGTGSPSSLSPLSSLRSSDCPAMSPVRPSSPGVCRPSPRSRSTSPVPEGFVAVPPQAPLGRWIDPGPMWEDMANDLGNSIDCSREVEGEGTWDFLDRPVPSFTYPPIHPSRRRC